MAQNLPIQTKAEKEKSDQNKQKTNSQDGRFKPNHINNHIKCKWFLPQLNN